MIQFQLLSDEQIENSPSARDGISPNEEREMRKRSCTFIRQLCKNLDLYPFVEDLFCSS